MYRQAAKNRRLNRKQARPRATLVVSVSTVLYDAYVKNADASALYEPKIAERMITCYIDYTHIDHELTDGVATG